MPIARPSVVPCIRTKVFKCGELNGVEAAGLEFVAPLERFRDARRMTWLLAGIDELRDVGECILSREATNPGESQEAFIGRRLL